MPVGFCGLGARGATRATTRPITFAHPVAANWRRAPKTYALQESDGPNLPFAALQPADPVRGLFCHRQIEYAPW